MLPSRLPEAIMPVPETTSAEMSFCLPSRCLISDPEEGSRMLMAFPLATTSTDGLPGAWRKNDRPFTAAVLSVITKPASPVLGFHSRTVLSQLPLASRLASRQKATALTAAAWPSRHCSSSADSESHTLMVESSLPLASRTPSGRRATQVTAMAWPSSLWMSSPLLGSHSLTLLSSLPLIRAPPSSRNARHVTPLVCPFMVARTLPEATLHRRMRLSQLAVARVAASGLKATAVTSSLWASRLNSFSPVAESHRAALVSSEPEASSLPSPLMDTELMPLAWAFRYCSSACHFLGLDSSQPGGGAVPTEDKAKLLSRGLSYTLSGSISGLRRNSSL
mmetsp:Transcript_19501/g.54244  ORF Transcript_19501/g.54244 Transcript_19501/m.54244 type:complete len:335 (-) Transcript_19501:225-1229(-)